MHLWHYFVFLGLSCATGHLLAANLDTPSSRKSGYESMSAQNKRLQDDPNLNPASFWVMDGRDLWNKNQGNTNRSCASCHADAEQSMRGVAARYPMVRRNQLINLEGQINYCRTQHLKANALGYESRDLLALTAYVANQSKSLPIRSAVDESADRITKEHFDAGKSIFYRRLGQLNLACAQCHEERPGLRLGGSEIPQGHPTGYPIYRLEWQAMGSLQRRLRNCMISVRAEPYAYGSQEFIQLELFLMWRANGMTLETPAVRP